MNIGAAMREARKNSGFTQIQLAKELDMAVNSIRLYESGKRIPSIDQRIKIAEALDCSPFDFMTEGEAEAFSAHFQVGYWAREEEFHDEVEFAIEELQYRKDDPLYTKMIAAYKVLNMHGKVEASKRVVELSQIATYQRRSPQKPPVDDNQTNDTPE